jgi:DnaJ-class molecular chaperone
MKEMTEQTKGNECPVCHGKGTITNIYAGGDDKCFTCDGFGRIYTVTDLNGLMDAILEQKIELSMNAGVRYYIAEEVIKSEFEKLIGASNG